MHVDNEILNRFVESLEKSLSNFVEPRLKWRFCVDGGEDDVIVLLDQVLKLNIYYRYKYTPIFTHSTVIGNSCIDFTINKFFVNFYLVNSKSWKEYLCVRVNA